jgi:hypothetical protein
LVGSPSLRSARRRSPGSVTIEILSGEAPGGARQAAGLRSSALCLPSSERIRWERVPGKKWSKADGVDGRLHGARVIDREVDTTRSLVSSTLRWKRSPVSGVTCTRSSIGRIFLFFNLFNLKF